MVASWSAENGGKVSIKHCGNKKKRDQEREAKSLHDLFLPTKKLLSEKKSLHQKQSSFSFHTASDTERAEG